MKTGFTNAFANKPLNKYYYYHGMLISCPIQPDPDPFIKYPTPEAPTCEWNPLLATWISPTSHRDPNWKWVEPLKAYDDNWQTYAFQYIPASSWSTFLTLYHDTLWANKIIIDTSGFPADVHIVDIDVFYGGVWHDIYEGWFQWGEDIVKYINVFWKETGTLLTDPKKVSACRVKFLNENIETDRLQKLWEVHFWGIYPLC